MSLDEKNNKPYQSLLIVSVILIAIPILLWIMIGKVLNDYSDTPEALNEAMARALGFGIGFLFHLGCIIGGVLQHPFKMLKKRIKEFISNIRISFKVAVKIYFLDVKNDGIIFTVVMLIILACALVCLDGVRDSMRIVNAIY